MLYLKNTDEYEKRLGTRDKHQYQKFNIESSINQQEAYLKLADEVEKETKNIKVIRYDNGDCENYEEKINKELDFLF